jgi:hypothetical protein
MEKDDFYQFLHKTYIIHPVLLSLALYALGGAPYLVWGMVICLRWNLLLERALHLDTLPTFKNLEFYWHFLFLLALLDIVTEGKVSVCCTRVLQWSQMLLFQLREGLLLLRIFLLGVCYKWMVMWMLG